MPSLHSQRTKNMGISLIAVSGGVLVVGLLAAPSFSENTQYALVAAGVGIGALVVALIGALCYGVSKVQEHRINGRFDEHAIRSINTHMSNLNSAVLLLSLGMIGLYVYLQIAQSSSADIIIALIVAMAAFSAPPLLVFLAAANGLFYRIATIKSRKLLVATTVVSTPVGIYLTILAFRTIL